MADLDTIKIVLRSLLISSNRSMTVTDLARDFRESEGYDIPFAALGYRSLTAFLQAVPDTVVLLCNGLVRAVTTKETAHIQQLVALQKKPKPKRRSTYGFSRGSSFFGSSRPPSRAPRFSSGSSYRSSYQSEQTYRPRYDGPLPSQSIEKHFEKVREVKEQFRREALASTSRSELSPLPHQNEAGWSGEAFIRDWQKQRAQEGDSQIKRVLLPERDSSDDSDGSFYERFKDDDHVDNQEARDKPESNLVQASKPNSFIESSCTINDRLKGNLKTLIKSYPKGIWACVLPEKYQEKFGVSLNWNELGYDSVVQMAHDLLDIFVCKRVKSGDWMLFDKSLPLPSEANEKQFGADPAPVVPDLVKEKIFNIVKKYTSGIRAEQLVQLYEECYGKSLRIESPGFVSPEALFLSIQDTVIHMRYIRKECYIYPGQQPPQPQLPVLVVDADTKKELGLYPDEVLGPGETYSAPVLPDDLEPGTYIELRVAEIYNPHKFWVMIRENSLRLDGLMDELQDFYHDHGDKYAMPDATITEGQCCTTLYEGEWHRAIIKSVGEVVEVLYVDYGTLAKAPKKDLRFIHRDFCDLPSQAIRASMCGIQPPNGRQRFTREANHALLDLVVDKHLIGLVQSIERNEPFLELFLIDTNGETDIHLNDVLVNLNHAVFKPEISESSETLEEVQADVKLPEQDVGEPVPTVPAASSSTPSPLLSTTSTTITTSDHTKHTPPYINQVNPAQSGTTQPSQLPPPGFASSTMQSQAVPPVMNMGGFGAYGANSPLNPLLNPALAAYSAACLPQMNAAMLMQQQLQQQQQALLLAYYQNLYQQQSAASLLASQTKNAAVPGMFGGSPWLGSIAPPQQSGNVNNPLTQFNNSLSATDVTNKSPVNSSPSKPMIPAKDSDAAGVTVAKTKQEPIKHPSLEDISSCSFQSDSSEDHTIRKKKVTKRKRQESRPSPSSSDNCVVYSSQPDFELPNRKLSGSSAGNESMRPVLKSSIAEFGNTHQRTAPLSEDSSLSSDDVADIVVEHLDELIHNSDSCEEASPTSLCHNIAPDIVQSVASLSISHDNTLTNYWKIVDINGQSLHLFNVDDKAYVSTGELARKFTAFSTCDTLVRVLKNKDICIPFKKITRQERLSLFSALDGYSEEIVKSFDLNRNRNGSVVGTFHLTPLVNIPGMLIPLGINISQVKDFQKLRDSFNPIDCYWTQ